MLELAQTVGNTDISLVTLVTQVGLSGVFLWQWYDANRERRASQSALAQLFERLLPVLEEATATLERVQAGMEKQVEKAERATPTPNEMASTIRRLEDLTDDLARRLRRSETGEERRR